MIPLRYGVLVRVTFKVCGPDSGILEVTGAEGGHSDTLGPRLLASAELNSGVLLLCSISASAF